MLKIAFIFNSSYSNSIGGAESNVLDFARRVNHERMECAVVSLQKPQLLNARLEELGIYNTNIYGNTAQVAAGLVGFLRNWRPDIVQAYGVRAGVLGRTLGKMANASVVAPLVGANPWRPPVNVALDRVTAPFVDRWIANCQAGKRLEGGRLGIPPGKISVVYGGVDPAQYQRSEVASVAKSRLGLRPSDHVVVEIANLRPMKGHSLLLQSASSIVKRVGPTVFMFVGDDRMNGALQAEAKAMGVGRWIRFVGGQADVRPYLAAADVFALPSSHEGMPTSILEAMSMELPVVATAVGGIPEIFTHGVGGMLVQPGDASSLQETLVTLLLDPLLRTRLGEAARHRVVDSFSLNRMADDYVREYILIRKHSRGLRAS